MLHVNSTIVQWSTRTTWRPLWLGKHRESRGHRTDSPSPPPPSEAQCPPRPRPNSNLEDMSMTDHEPDKLKPGEPLYRPEINPHNVMIPTGPPGDLERLWKCGNCDAPASSIEELDKTPCSYEYPVCPHCGQTPICAWDCNGIWELLSSPDVYVTGADHDN